MTKTKFSNLDKVELERLKLISEVKENNRPFIIRHFASIVVLFLTCASLFMGFYTGLFDAKRENLELDIKKFENEKQALKESIDTLKSQVSDYTMLVTSLRSQSSKALEEEKKAKEQLKISEDERQNQLQEFERIKGQNLADKEKIKRLTNLIETYEKSAEQNIREINNLTSKLQDETRVNSVLSTYLKDNVGNVVVLNNTNNENFDAIIGRVVDENEIPIDGAQILFKKSLHGPYTKMSDSNGSFSIKFKYDNQNKGRTFPIEISKNGYETISTYVVVGSIIKVKLKKSA